MPKFHVNGCFEMTTDRPLFVMAGSIVEGEIRPGMFVHIPFNHRLGMKVRIHSIEFMRALGTDEVCLCIEADPDEMDIFQMLNIGDETFEITEEGPGTNHPS